MTTASHWKAIAPLPIATPALVAKIELALPTAALEIAPPYRAARVLATLHGRPVGYADLGAGAQRHYDHSQLVAALDPRAVARAREHLLADLQQSGAPLPPGEPGLAELLELAAQLGAPACAAALPAHGPLVSVAVCTRDRAHMLGDTLASLACQSYADLEILVIDNAPSSDATERLVREHYPAMRYVLEPRAGLNYARNRAFDEARGEIVAFIDDDAIADQDWVAALAPLFGAPDVLCATGLVAPARLDTAGQDMFERYGYSKGFQQLAFRLSDPPPNTPGFPYKGYLGTGCNCALRRDALELVGPFDPRLDMGSAVPGGGDHDMFARVIRSGYTLVYDPNPIVFHQHIADLKVVVKRLGQYQESFLAFVTKAIVSDAEYALPLARHMAYWYLRRTARGLGAALSRRDRPFALVLCEALGGLRGPISFYRSHRQVARAQGRKQWWRFGGGPAAPSESFSVVLGGEAAQHNRDPK